MQTIIKYCIIPYLDKIEDIDYLADLLSNKSNIKINLIESLPTFHTIYNGYVDVLYLEDFEAESSDILVYPNPTNSSINLEVTDELIGESYMIFDAYGRLLERDEIEFVNTKLNLSGYKSGYYFLRVGDRNENVAKLIKW
jgi:hypothetical protein